MVSHGVAGKPISVTEKRQAWVSQMLLQFLNALPGRWLLWVHVLEFGQLKETVKANFPKVSCKPAACCYPQGCKNYEIMIFSFFFFYFQILEWLIIVREKSVFWNLENCLSNLILDNRCSNSWYRCVLEHSLLPTEQTELFFEMKIIICCIFFFKNICVW